MEVASCCSSTQLECTCCGESIPYNSTIVKVQVVTYSWNNGFDRTPCVDALGNEVYEDNVFLNDDEQRPAYDEDTGEVTIVGDTCWDCIDAAMIDEMADVPPVETTDDPITCNYCGSAIMLGEPCGWVQSNLVKLSKRRPVVDGVTLAPYVQTPNGDGFNVCLPCLRIINDNVVTMWVGGISYNGECEECTTKRCWLHTCECGCHSNG